MQHVERVLNADFATYVTCDDPNNILGAQIAFLVSRFDILLESISAASNSGQFAREHLFSRPYRGRDHQLPLYYQKNMNAFTFRS
ncbi:unnamed protein product [Brugia pahangi]|uniref:ANF_receptor domain-containing protein n=1 Tax=Brugia pahangi TaxID=6280 RepID=A0A0N4THK0_BRUPA|nr:unnamed protein product [Brugia pahangi]